MSIPSYINELFQERQKLRSARQYTEADSKRKEIEAKGYVIIDRPEGSTIEALSSKSTVKESGWGKIALFGSGETSPTGRRVHEELIKDFPSPVRIALLETPAGFEQNPHLWYGRMREYLIGSLTNYHPQVELVGALRKDGLQSTNDNLFLSILEKTDYIHAGAGSPTYAAKHLKDSVALKIIRKMVEANTAVSLASASVCAFSRYVLPVYEIYKAGHDLYWEEGIGFFREWGIDPIFVPHWNNQEGGLDIDTSRCYMGVSRFEKMVNLLPPDSVIVGIDEQTAIVMDISNKSLTVHGVGTVTLIRKGKEKIFSNGSVIPFAEVV